MKPIDQIIPDSIVEGIADLLKVHGWESPKDLRGLLTRGQPFTVKANFPTTFPQVTIQYEQDGNRQWLHVELVRVRQDTTRPATMNSRSEYSINAPLVLAPWGENGLKDSFRDISILIANIGRNEYFINNPSEIREAPCDCCGCDCC